MAIKSISALMGGLKESYDKSKDRSSWKMLQGESGVIALAKKHDWIAVLDDLDARKIAVISLLL